MSESIANTALMSIRDDNDPGFYAPPQGAGDPEPLGYAFGGEASDILIRITPARVDLPKGAPVDFTVHIKALHDFDAAHPLFLRLLPEGRGSASFATPDTAVVFGRADVKFDGERILITMKKTDEAARVIIHTEYPPDWWAGSTKLRVDAGGETTPTHSVEANVVVSDRVPASWGPLGVRGS